MRPCLQVLFLVSDCWNLLRMPRGVVLVLVLVVLRGGETKKHSEGDKKEDAENKWRTLGLLEKINTPGPLHKKSFCPHMMWCLGLFENGATSSARSGEREQSH